jgi:NADPH:quinone reductase-like Zn-dependent oxidoreductase
MATDSFRAYVAETKGEGPKRGVTTMATDDLPADGVLVVVAWSSVNYKDALA